MDWIVAVAVTSHLGLAGDYREFHPHVQARGDLFVAGAYLNSEDRVSVYAGLRWQRGPWWLEAAAVTGYTGSDVAPMIRVGYEIERLSVFVSPAYEYEPESRVGLVVGAELTVWRR